MITTNKRFTGSPLFYQQMCGLRDMINHDFKNKGIPKKISLAETADLFGDLLLKGVSGLEILEFIQTGRKGKRIKFQGELRL